MESKIIVIKELLYEFMHMIECEQIEVYNEFSLQHELHLFKIET